MTTPPDGPPNPYGTPEGQPEGQPGSTPYGAPQQPPQPPNPYGAPQQPYGAAPAQPYGGAPGQPYGGAFPAGPGGAEPPKGKGMAIAALVLALIPCGLTTLISLVLAIVVLAKKGGGKGLAIAAIVIDLLVFIVLIGLVVAGVLLGGESVDSLKEGQCVTAKGLNGNTDESVSQIKIVGCSTKHDGQVLATVKLSSDDASSFGDETANTLCEEAIGFSDEELVTFVTEGYNYIGLTQSTDPSAGDKLACIAFAEDGSSISEKIG